MRFEGDVRKDGNFWLAEIPILDAMTQGRTRKEALQMAGDLVETLANREGFSVNVYVKGNRLEIGSEDTRTMVALLVRRLRERRGLSLAQAAQRIGSSSRNAYGRYEQGASLPSFETFDRLWQALSEKEFVVTESSVD